MWGSRSSLSLPVGMQNDAAAWEGSFAVSYREVNISVPYDSAITLLGIYPGGLNTHACRKICTQMFIAVLFIIAKTLKQLRYPSVAK